MGQMRVVTPDAYVSLARESLAIVCDKGHITKEQLSLLLESIPSVTASDFVSRMSTEGVKGPALAGAMAQVLDWPLYSVGQTRPKTKTETFLIGEDNVCYIVNPLDVQGHNAISDQLQGLDIEGWGIIPQLVLQEAEGNVHSVITNPDQSKQFIHNLIYTCYLKGGSDVHLQPRGNEVLVRMRIDGSLRNIQSIPIEGFWDIAGTLMTECELNAGEYIRPWDGRFIVQPTAMIRIPVRLAGIQATTAGQLRPKYTLRLLSSKQELVDLETLGFSRNPHNNQFRDVTEAFRKPYGMLIVTGPTGSGKSTTLFAAMRWMMARRPTDSYYTLEDPVEAELPGAVQIQCFAKEDAGPTFASGLRNLLRQDPDTILLGEIRDKETAELGVKAAITGHRVLSTLHANSAPGAATRLRDIGIDPTLMSDALTMLSAQRIVPRLCPYCCRKGIWSEVTTNRKHPIFEGHNNDVIERFIEAPQRYSNLKLYPKPNDSVGLYSPSGCERCDGRGSKGRVLIAEVLTMTSEIKSLVAKPNTTEADILMLAQKQGFRPMWEHAFEACVDGNISLIHAEDALGPLPIPTSD